MTRKERFFYIISVVCLLSSIVLLNHFNTIWTDVIATFLAAGAWGLALWAGIMTGQGS
jgi:hypothetical protein